MKEKGKLIIEICQTGGIKYVFTVAISKSVEIWEGSADY
jgi:hypothetical protein